MVVQMPVRPRKVIEEEPFVCASERIERDIDIQWLADGNEMEFVRIVIPSPGKRFMPLAANALFGAEAAKYGRDEA
jgi:hypothetical protein